MFIIPNQESKQHLQDNKSDLTGTIYKSRNISLDEQGYIKLAETTFAQYSEVEDSDFDVVDAMYPGSGTIYLNSDDVYSGTAGVDQLYDATNYGWTDTPTPGVEEDCIYFNGSQIATEGSSVSYLVGTDWTPVSVSGGVFSTSSPTCLTLYGTSLAVGNNNCVKFIDTSWVVSGTVLLLPAEYQVSSMASVGDNLYIATRSKSGGEAKLFIIDAIKTSADYSYPVGTFELASIKSFKSTVVGINSLGELVRFNGGGFDTLAILPIYKNNLEWCDAQNDYSSVSNRGLTTDGDLIYIHLQAETQTDKFRALPDFPAGIWCYDDSNKSLYHRYSASFSTLSRIANAAITVDAAANTFTTNSDTYLTGVITGMPVFYGATTAIPELKTGGKCYFIIKVSARVFKLATTYANAVAGTAIDISTTGTTNAFYIVKTNDYGWSYYPSSRSAMAILNSTLFLADYVGRICMSADLRLKNGNSGASVFCPISAYLPNRGYFVTPRLNSSQVTDNQNKLTIKWKPLDTEDSIIVKYKTTDRYDIPFSSVRFATTAYTATWATTTSFTTTADLSGVIVGDELEITGGVGSGHMTRIASLTLLAGTWTVTIDEAFPFAVATDKLYFQIDNWTLLTTITSSNTDNYYETQIGSSGKFIQVKVEMRGIGTTIEELQIDNQSLISSKK